MMTNIKKLVAGDIFKACLIGQSLSFLLAITGTTSGILANAGINAPTTQSFFNYCLLSVICGAVHLWLTRSRGNSISSKCGPLMLSNKWYVYLALALLDVEGNYLVTKAYQYTSITSVTLLDSTTIPAVMMLSWLVFRSRYLPGHALGALMCMIGLAVLVLTDGSSETGGSNPFWGDILVVLGACVYAVCNIAQEKLLTEQTSRWELLAMLGLFGSIISGVQALVLERSAWHGAAWGPSTAAAMAGFVVSLFLFYILVPSVLVMGSSTVLNLSLLTSDLWAAVSRVAFFGGFGGTGWAFAMALVAEVAGIGIYAWSGETHKHDGRGDKAGGAWTPVEIHDHDSESPPRAGPLSSPSPMLSSGAAGMGEHESSALLGSPARSSSEINMVGSPSLLSPPRGNGAALSEVL